MARLRIPGLFGVDFASLRWPQCHLASSISVSVGFKTSRGVPPLPGHSCFILEGLQVIIGLVSSPGAHSKYSLRNRYSTPALTDSTPGLLSGSWSLVLGLRQHASFYWITKRYVYRSRRSPSLLNNFSLSHSIPILNFDLSYFFRKCRSYGMPYGSFLFIIGILV